jgi:hypothetical protein
MMAMICSLGELRRGTDGDPRKFTAAIEGKTLMLVAMGMFLAALTVIVCSSVIAEICALFGGEAFGHFLRDAGQQVGGAGGLGAAGAGAAGAARRYEQGIEFEEDGDVTPWREIDRRNIEERDRSFWGGATKVSRQIQRAAEYFVGTDILGTVPGGSKG